MNIKPIVLDYYKNKTYSINYDVYTKPVFHGTRRYALTCSRNELDNFLKASGLVIDYVNKLWVTMPNIDIDNYRRKTLINGIHSLMGQSMYNSGLSNYQYGDFYVTTGLWNAIHYSNNAGGELGEYAYHYVIGIKDLNISINDDKIKEACATILKEYPLFNKSSHVILMTDHIDYKDLEYEAGDPFINKEYLDELNDDINDIYDTYERDNESHILSFRLKHSEEYQYYIIEEKDFKQALNYFSDFKNIDKLIRDAKYESNCNMDYLIES